jgi:hypothetical protein
VESKNIAMVKITPKHFSTFKQEVLFWVDYFGLKDWDISLQNKDIEENRANCCCNITAHRCVISLNVEYDEELNDFQLRKSAFHEVCELLLWRLGNLGIEGYPHKYVDDETHKIIITLENTVFSGSYKKRFK